MSETQTQYIGAHMLRGGEDVTFDSVVPGYVGDESYLADGRYAYFSGNTLYAGTQDDEGNYVDLIAEFFWFESSIDRGSDFYVAVVKARTSPNLAGDWVLERQSNKFTGLFLDDQDATLYLRAQTDVAQGNGSFRWDWSIPFDSYGWDAYGNIKMNTSYGLSANAEGSAQKAVETDVHGVDVEANVQTKGFFNTDYVVQTSYEVTLWRWEVLVHGSAGQIDWQMNLHSPDRENQNAYHEFFVVMQADEGVPFHLDWLEVGGSVKNPVWWWWDDRRSLSAAVTGLVLRQPPMPGYSGENNVGNDGELGSEPTDEPNDGVIAPVVDWQRGDEDRPLASACNLAADARRESAPSWLLFLGLSMLATARRRRS